MTEREPHSQSPGDDIFQSSPESHLGQESEKQGPSAAIPLRGPIPLFEQAHSTHPEVIPTDLNISGKDQPTGEGQKYFHEVGEKYNCGSSLGKEETEQGRIYVSISEAAKISGYHEDYIRELINEGKLSYRQEQKEVIFTVKRTRTVKQVCLGTLLKWKEEKYGPHKKDE